MLGERRRRVLVIPINGASGASTGPSGELCGGTMSATPASRVEPWQRDGVARRATTTPAPDAPCASRA
jgi:hypothetical protein